jgi:hypothetical protein
MTCPTSGSFGSGAFDIAGVSGQPATFLEMSGSARIRPVTSRT